jgi:hypothetical protein
MTASRGRTERVAAAAKGRSPPFTSQCAWRSICYYQPLVSNETNGPLLPFTATSRCSGAARRSRHSRRAQHFLLVSWRADSFGYGVCGSRTVQPVKFSTSERQLVDWICLLSYGLTFYSYWTITDSTTSATLTARQWNQTLAPQPQKLLSMNRR